MALLSLMARLGSSRPVEPARSLDELAAGFDIASFGAAPTKFDAEDLWPLNRAWLAGLDHSAVAGRLEAMGVPAADVAAFWEAMRANISRFDDLAAWWAICRDGAEPAVAPEDRAFVDTALTLLPPRPWGPETWGEWTGRVKAATGRKGRALFAPLRAALTGRDSGPEMAALMPLLRRVAAAA
jgi:glutamyl-tRNA synthetase